jgi:hypothetical protein
MFGDRRLRNAGVTGQHPHRLLAGARQPLNDRATRWIGKGCEKLGWCNGHKNP